MDDMETFRTRKIPVEFYSEKFITGIRQETSVFGRCKQGSVDFSCLVDLGLPHRLLLGE